MNGIKESSYSDIEKLRHSMRLSRIIGMSVVVFALLVLLLILIIRDPQSNAFIVGIGVIVLIISLGSFAYTEVKQKKLTSLVDKAIDKRFFHFTQNELIKQLEEVTNFTGKIKQLLDSKNYSEAEKLAYEQWKTNPDNTPILESYISTLLAYSTKEKCEAAVDILNKSETRNPSLDLRAAFLMWEFGDNEKAISIAKNGLEIAKRKGDNNIINKFKNSLAYYYAVSGKAEYEKLAMSYITDALNDQPDDPSRIDTKGYVKIQFGRTKEEILEGLQLCFEAYKLDPEHFKMPYEKHSKIATDKINNLLQEGGRKL